MRGMLIQLQLCVPSKILPVFTAWVGLQAFWSATLCSVFCLLYARVVCHCFLKLLASTRALGALRLCVIRPLLSGLLCLVASTETVGLS